MAPMWPPGTASGYHPVTFGYLAGEIFRRIDGRTVGVALAQDVAGPLGLDLWIGLPEAEDPRLAEMRRPQTMPDLGEITEPRRVAFMTKWATSDARGSPAWRRAEIPSANGHATAPALARLMAAMACDGLVAGRRILAPGVAARAARGRIAGRRTSILPLRDELGQPASCVAVRLRTSTDRAPRPSAIPAGAAAWPSPIRSGACPAPM